jgi:hypothetical protein
MRKLLSLLLLLPLRLLAQDLQPVAELDTQAIRIGEQTRLKLSVNYRVDQGGPVTILWPTVTGDTLTGHIEVLEDSGVDTVVNPDDPMRFQQMRQFRITSFDSGYWAIPPFRFVVNGDTTESNALLLGVETVEVDTTQAIRDIKEIYELPFSLADWLREHWQWFAGGAAILVALIALILFLKQRKRKPIAQPEAPPKSLQERMLEALAEIDRRKLWQQGQVKQYHSEVTDLLRVCVEERHGIPALERTTDELLAELGVSAMGRDSRELLGNMLRLADLVKFAKYTALPAENEQLMSSAVRFVQLTTDTPLPDA